ncbi:hypothetical protein F3J29_09940 [Enterobacter sp. Cy-643]|uniref:hypothetical protein n=1 Tax=Enterobacter sp. Cy-643 TaxID=2608346 RepID=UPI00141EDF65|nr:hypothetical protein [Enterobacter sp. Cy-643]NIF32459.1 hypothetical protein [Enterobacter sp. Cy-643]
MTQQSPPMMVFSECQYLFLGLSNLLPGVTLSKIDMVNGKLSSDVDNTGGVSVVFSTPGKPYIELIKLIESLREEGFKRIYFVGTLGELTFLDECGVRPERFFLRHSWHKSLSKNKNVWLEIEPRMVRFKKLSKIERRAIVHALNMHPENNFNGVEKKSFYNRRAAALRKLGLRNIRELLVNSITGEPVSGEHYQRYFFD